MINYIFLSHFYEVVRQKGFLKAARALKTSQPNVSRSIKLLESQLGVQLLQRNRSNIKLTSEGTRLYALAVEVMGAMDRYSSETTSESRRTTLKISASENLCIHILPKLISSLHSQFDHVNFEVTASTAEESEEKVVGFESDLGLAFHAPKHSGLLQASLAKVPFFLVVSNKSPVRSVADIKNLRFIGSKSANYSKRYFALNALEKNKIKADILVETNSQEMQLRLVEQGLGFTVVPAFFLKEYPTLKRVTGFQETANLYAFYRKTNLTPESKALIQMVKAAF